MNNRELAEKLKGYAHFLRAGGGNVFRVRAYLQAAGIVESLSTPVQELLDRQGIEALQKLPGIGDHLAFTIERLLHTGQFYSMTAEAESLPPRQNLRSLRGVGPHLAEMLWEKKGIVSIDQLQKAMEQNQLRDLPLSEKQLDHLRQALVQWQKEQAIYQEELSGEPAIADLLAIDQEFRKTDLTRQLPHRREMRLFHHGENYTRSQKIRRKNWRYHVRYSNSSLAHRLGLYGDWVVIYFQDAKGNKGQRTVVTEYRGSLAGKRVVRGREEECAQYYLPRSA